MKKIIYILALAFCYSLSSCRPQKEAATDNPYLTHYLPEVSDSVGNPVHPQTVPDRRRRNLEQIRQNVNPVKTTVPLGDTLRNILESIFSTRPQ